jgi:hypothetical protein
VLRFIGLSAGAHTIRLTIKGGSSPILAPNYGFVEANPSDGPLVVTPMAPRPYAYTLWSGFAFGPNHSTNPMNDAGLGAIALAKRQVHAEFIKNQFVEVNLDPLIGGQHREMWYADNGHPSSYANGIVARELALQIQQRLTKRQRAAFVHFSANGPYWQPVGSMGGPSFANSWVNFGGALFNDAAFRYDHQSNRVHLRGMIKSGTVQVNSTGTAFVLPAGLRPKLINDFAVTANGAYGAVRVYPSGWVNVVAGNNAYVSLDGISFDAEV